MSEHTPGPWTPMTHTNNTRTIYGQERAVAVVQDLSDYPGMETETEGNTLLISAAPEMLELLKVMWVCIPGHVLQQYGLSEEEIHAVIAKAEGDLP